MPRRSRRPRSPDRSTAFDQPAEPRARLALPSRRDPMALEHLRGLRDRLTELYTRLEAQVESGENRPPRMLLTPARDDQHRREEHGPDRAECGSLDSQDQAAHSEMPPRLPVESVHHRAGAALCDPGHFVWEWGQVIGRSDDYDHAAHTVARGLARREWTT